MPTGNPMYSDYPVVPPGFEGFRYMAGQLMAPFIGGSARPYVGPNQSTFDAQYAQQVNDPLYKQMLERVYGQMGQQMGASAAGIAAVQGLGKMVGYTPEQIRRDMQGFGSAMGRSQLGGFVMSFADQAMASAGLTNGSYIDAFATLANNRHSLMSAGTMLNPLNGGQAYQAMAGASAMSHLLNAITAKDGGATPNLAFTQGFDKNRIANLATMMAGAGAFTTKDGGFTDSLSQAAGGFDISKLDYSQGDFTGNAGDESRFSKEQAEKIRKFTGTFTRTMKAGIDALGAMRDMLKEVDGLEEKLTALTGGSWLKSARGAQEAGAAIRRMSATMKAFNLDPKEGWNQMMQRRSLLQDAAGFGDMMQAYGFDGGGMFGAEASTELMTNIEDMINARGVRGNPVLANRIRLQGTQAFARNMNTQAGVAAQLLAYGRQQGIFSDEAAKALGQDMASGDRSVINDTINQMLIRMFGSKEAGREKMRDATFVASIRQAMNGEAGRFATRVITKGADAEYSRRELFGAADNRLRASKQNLGMAGFSGRQTDEGIGLIIDNLVGDLNQASGTDKAGDFIRSEFESRVRGGMSRQAALSATMSAFRNDPLMQRYAETMDLSFKNQSALNNERTFTAGGLEGMQAKSVVDAMLRHGSISGEQASQVRKLLSQGDSSGALSMVNNLMGGVSDVNLRTHYGKVMGDAGDRYNAAVDQMGARRDANSILQAALTGKYGSTATADTFDKMIDSLRAFAKGDFNEQDRDNLYAELEGSGITKILGDDQLKAIYGAVNGVYVQGGDKEAARKNLQRVIGRFGRASSILRQNAATTLSGSGYGLSMNGFFGGGRYGGNTRALEEQRAKLIGDMANADADAAEYDAGDRSTWSQDVLATLTDKDWKHLLHVRDKGGTIAKLAEKYGYEGKLIAFNDAQSALDNDEGLKGLFTSLNKSGNTEAVRVLRGMLSNVDDYSEQNVTDFITKYGLDAKQADALEGIVGKDGKARKLSAARKAMNQSLKDIAGAEGYTDAAKNLSAVMATDNTEKQKRLARIQAKYGDTLSYMEGMGLDDEDLTGAAGSAYKALEGLVSDKDVMQKLGLKTLEGRDQREIRRARVSLFSEKVRAGDKDALGVANQYKAIRDQERAMKIKGELILRSGSDQATTALEAASVVGWGGT